MILLLPLPYHKKGETTTMTIKAVTKSENRIQKRKGETTATNDRKN